MALQYDTHQSKRWVLTTVVSVATKTADDDDDILMMHMSVKSA